MPPRPPRSGAGARYASTQRKIRQMEKNRKKKTGTGSPKGVKVPSEYKSREVEGRISQTDAAFHKPSGKAKDLSRKG